MNESVKFKSGNVLVIQPAPFAVASALRRVIMAEMKSVVIDTSGLDFSNLLGSGIPLNTVKDLICQLLASEKVENAVWDCMSKGPATLNYMKMTPAMFDGPEGFKLREDYLNCALEVALANLMPFISGLDLSLLRPAKTETPSGPV